MGPVVDDDLDAAFREFAIVLVFPAADGVSRRLEGPERSSFGAVPPCGAFGGDVESDSGFWKGGQTRSVSCRVVLD
jgi:hypothetical protein